MVSANAGLDKFSSAPVRYQSLVIGVSVQEYLTQGFLS
jgi:hypothetical protein